MCFFDTHSQVGEEHVVYGASSLQPLSSFGKRSYFCALFLEAQEESIGFSDST